MAANTTQNLSPLAALALGLFLTIGVGLFAFLDKIFGTALFEALLVGYGISGAALGVYLLEQSTAISGYFKYIVVIITATIGYGFGQYAHLQIVDYVAVATLIIALSSFVLDELQKYAPQLPAAVVNDGTLIIGGVVVIATAVKNAPAGSVISVSALLAVVVPALFIYIIQKTTPGVVLVPGQPIPGPAIPPVATPVVVADPNP